MRGERGEKSQKHNNRNRKTSHHRQIPDAGGSNSAANYAGAAKTATPLVGAPQQHYIDAVENGVERVKRGLELVPLGIAGQGAMGVHDADEIDGANQ